MCLNFICLMSNLRSGSRFFSLLNRRIHSSLLRRRIIQPLPQLLPLLCHPRRQSWKDGLWQQRRQQLREQQPEWEKIWKEVDRLCYPQGTPHQDVLYYIWVILFGTLKQIFVKYLIIKSVWKYWKQSRSVLDVWSVWCCETF